MHGETRPRVYLLFELDLQINFYPLNGHLSAANYFSMGHQGAAYSRITEVLKCTYLHHDSNRSANLTVDNVILVKRFGQTMKGPRRATPP